MYSIRPYTSDTAELDLPTTMYSVKPVIESTKPSTINSVLINQIEQRQDILLEKIENLYHQLLAYQTKQSTVELIKSIREELVIHLPAKQPSKNILNLIEQFRNNLSIRTYRHSSVRDNSFTSPIQNSTSSAANRSLAIVWADREDLPYMFHSNMKINDEQAIVNLLNHQLTNNNNN